MNALTVAETSETDEFAAVVQSLRALTRDHLLCFRLEVGRLLLDRFCQIEFLNGYCAKEGGGPKPGDPDPCSPLCPNCPPPDSCVAKVPHKKSLA